MKANEMLELISKQWASSKDIMNIGQVGIGRARKILREITEELEKQKKVLPRNLVPMELVVEHFDININYLKKVRREIKQ